VNDTAIVERLYDLHREKRILAAKRRNVVKRGQEGGREVIDRRLADIRREFTCLEELLYSRGHMVDFREPQKEEREESTADKIRKLHEERKRAIEVLEGDAERIERVNVLYDEKLEHLFDEEGDQLTSAY